MLRAGGALDTLRLSGNRLGPDGAQHLAIALAGNGCLTALELGRCQLGPEGAGRPRGRPGWRRGDPPPPTRGRMG